MSSQGPAKRRAAQAADKPIKRTRVSRACDQCRIAREKCNGTQPICSTCSTSKRICTYTADVKKRGIQPGYIRALELALAYLFQFDPGNETLVNNMLAQGGTSSLLLSRDSKESNKLHKRWRKARFYIDVDKLLSGGEPTRHDQPEASSPDSGEENSDTKEPSSLAGVNTLDLGGRQDQHTLPQSSNQWTSLAVQQPAVLGARMTLPLDSWRLIEVYFTYTQSWLPICSREDILKLSYSYPTEGLAISPRLPNSGFHAELWSVLAVATIHDTIGSSHVPQQDRSSRTPTQLYATARSLIPEETGSFDLGHVKAMLNLAIFDVGRSSIEAAWLLVGYASRILEVMDQSLLVINPRHKHVFHGCFLLDSMLAIYLEQRPYFRLDKVRLYGRIDEDGLDEWQPWNGQSRVHSGNQLRAPTLALSTLNAISEIIALWDDSEEPMQDKAQRLETWESSLPPKLASICASNPTGHLTPPTVLLQLTYYCIFFGFTSSQSWLLQSLNLLEQAQDQIGWRKLPPILRCLLEFINRRSAALSLSREVQNRLQRLHVAINNTWPNLGTQWETSGTAVQLATPLSNVQPIHQSVFGDDIHAALSPFSPTLPDTKSRKTPTRHVGSLQNAPMTLHLDSSYQEIPNDLESFFDDLACLDTANDLGNQPQFMQNLGFAPDANMADLFSEYIPMQSTTFLSQQNSDAVNLDHYGFYEGG